MNVRIVPWIFCYCALAIWSTDVSAQSEVCFLEEEATKYTIREWLQILEESSSPYTIQDIA